MIDKIKRLNPGIPIYSVCHPAFLPYGRVINGCDVSEVISECEKIKLPEFGSLYDLSVPALENLAVRNLFRNEYFGGMEIQVGLCWGHNKQLNGLEYHKSSEVNIAVTPMVLLLGLVYEMDGLTYHSGNVKGFFVEKGQVIEVYGATLHFCPCEVNENGFSSVVILHKGTNDLLDAETSAPLLYKKNKWLICHRDSSLTDRKVYPGIIGQNLEIRYS